LAVHAGASADYFNFRTFALRKRCLTLGAALERLKITDCISGYFPRHLTR
jgi:hypothetical protein